MKKKSMNVMREIISGYSARSFFLVPLMMCAAVAYLVPALSQDQASKVEVQKAPAKQTNEVSGSKLFHSYCAVCHGRDGRGNGPAAPALKIAPADLTLLAKRNGGKFPADHVMHVLFFESEYAVHGSKDMPIWGPIFRRMSPDWNLGRLRAYNLTEYLKSIQSK
jgi:mono/diheme cytochrome c family protein